MNSGIGLFLLLPTPIKILLVASGGFFFVGLRPAQVKFAQPQVVPAVPVKPIKPAPAAPKAAVKAAVPQKISVSLSLINGYSLNGKNLTEAALSKKLQAIAKANPACECTIVAEAQLPLQKATAALELCKKAGFKNVSFTMKAQ
ncbi:MAG: ExbD/TolR family protein [Akkermansiaceae bacterium]